MTYFEGALGDVRASAWAARSAYRLLEVLPDADRDFVEWLQTYHGVALPPLAPPPHAQNAQNVETSHDGAE
jgi:hypothetical protein